MERRQDITAKRGLQLVYLVGIFLLVSACVPGKAKPEDGLTLTKVLPSATATPPAPTHTATPAPLPTATATPEAACSERSGQLETLEIESEHVRKPLQFIVYTPPCYDPEGEIPYPVVYMLHGQGFQMDQWARLGMPETADRLITRGELPAFLMVLPYEEYNLDNPFGTGYEQALIEELVPWIDEHYFTCTQRPCRVVAGLSRGGSWALYLGVAHWELFGSIGAHSTAPFFGMDGWLSYYLGLMGKENFPRLLVDFGESDSLLGYMTQFQKKLDGYQLPYDYRLYPGNHTEEYWASHVEEYLRWYWQPWTQEE